MKREEYAKIIKRMVEKRVDKMEENGCWFSLFFNGYTNTYSLYMGELNNKKGLPFGSPFFMLSAVNLDSAALNGQYRNICVGRVCSL